MGKFSGVNRIGGSAGGTGGTVLRDGEVPVELRFAHPGAAGNADFAGFLGHRELDGERPPSVPTGRLPPRSGGRADHTCRNHVSGVDRATQAEVNPAGVQPVLAECFDQGRDGPRVHGDAADQGALESELGRACGRVDDVVDLERVFAIKECGD